MHQPVQALSGGSPWLKTLKPQALSSGQLLPKSLSTCPLLDHLHVPARLPAYFFLHASEICRKIFWVCTGCFARRI